MFRLLLIICLILNVKSANILGIFPTPGKSHHILGSTLLIALAERGHNVTMISQFPLKTKINNYEDIVLQSELDQNNKESMMEYILKPKKVSYVSNIYRLSQVLISYSQKFLEDDVVKKFLSSNRSYDLVIQCWTVNPSHLGIGHHFGASTIIFSTIGSSVLIDGVTRNPAPHSYVPNIFLEYSQNMNFLQRVSNTLANLYYDAIWYTLIKPTHANFLNKYFPNAPNIEELIANVSLVLLNAHHSIETARPYQPNMIQIGGFHVEKGEGLPKDVKDFMDSANEGVIFFSLGSNMKSAYLPDVMLQSIVNTFAKLPVKVLWKFEDENIPNISPNVKIGRWLPQRDILAHPNLKAFITHGGLLSTTEAVYKGVPIVGIPLFADQQTNVFEAVKAGFGIKLDIKDLTEETFTRAIMEILNNPNYRETAERRCQIMKDQPIKPLDNALYWVEYVLKHRGAHHLQTFANKLNWYQHNLIDVGLFLFVIIITIVTAIIYVLLKIKHVVKARFKKPKISLKIQKTKVKPKSKLA